MASLCCDRDCGCTKFTQSMFTGYTNSECSSCLHHRRDHISYGPATLDVQLMKWKNDQDCDVKAIKLLRMLSGHLQMETKTSLFSRRHINPPSYLRVLPSDLLSIVSKYLIGSTFTPVMQWGPLPMDTSE